MTVLRQKEPAGLQPPVWKDVRKTESAQPRRNAAQTAADTHASHLRTSTGVRPATEPDGKQLV